MSFAQIIFLLGSAGVVGPILAHLLARPRHRRVPFTMLRFLRIGHIETQARRRFRDFLVLALRCLIVLAIAAMFAGPRFVANRTDDEQRPVHVLALDDSLSMSYSDGGDSYFEQMSAKAKEYVEHCDANSVFSMYGLASGAQSGEVDSATALQFLSRLEPVPLGARLDDVVTAVREEATTGDEAREVNVLLISDFTPRAIERFAAIERPARAGRVTVEVLASSDPISNAAVVAGSLHAVRGGAAPEVSATVLNPGEVAQERELSIMHDGKPVASVEVSIPPHGRRIARVQLPPAVVESAESVLALELALSNGDGLRADDTYYLAAAVSEVRRFRVLVVGRDAREAFLLRTGIEALSRMASSEAFEVVSADHATFAGTLLSAADIVCFASFPASIGSEVEALAAFARRGGRVVAFAPADADPAVVQALSDGGVLPVAPGEFQVQPAFIAARPAAGARGTAPGEGDRAVNALMNYGLDGIILRGYHEFTARPEATCLWRFESGPGFMYAQPLGNGEVILVNTSADDSLGGLMKSPAAVAFCRFLMGRSGETPQLTFGVGEPIALPASDLEMQSPGLGGTVLLALPDGGTTQAVVSKGSLSLGGVNQMGWLRTVARPVRYAGVNLEEGETDLTKPDEEAVRAWAARLFVAREQAEAPGPAADMADKDFSPLWRILGAVAIGLILSEAMITNRLKR